MASASDGYNCETTSTHNLSDGVKLQSQGPKDAVVHRRIFIGPMPERVISQTEMQANQKEPKTTLGSVFSLSLEPDKSHGGDKIEEVTRLVKAHAFRFFVHEGGDPQNWDEQQEDNVADELMRRWKVSDWGELWTHRHDRRKGAGGSNNWFGTSFEVGSLLGVNLLQAGEHIHAKNPLMSSTEAGTSATQDEPNEVQVLARSTSTPLTSSSKSHLPISRIDTTSSKVSHHETIPESLMVNDPEIRDDAVPTPASSVTKLLHAGPASEQEQKAKSQPDLRISPKPKEVNRAQTDMPATNVKGKARMVHYEELPDSSPSPPMARPAPPEDVLSRNESTTDINTSSAAALQTELVSDRLTNPPEDEVKWGDIFLRDRMLIRASYTKDEGITHFDEEINRSTRDLRYEDWGEFIVAWRKDSLEIYRDHLIPCKERMTGHKHLSYVIPLKSSRTKLSLFSFTDLTFCITCAPTTSKVNPETSRWIFHREKEGTNIFIFKHKSRSRAYDWIWQLWRSMGGELPPSIEVYNPRLSVKVTIDIPKDESGNEEAGKVVTRKNVIQLCIDSLHDVPDWKYLVDEEIKKGYSLGLAWRSKAALDWIWLEDDVTGKPREWAVLCGLPLKQLASAPPALEIRVAYHAPSHIHLKDGTIAEEPPSIEGYLDRIRPNTQTKQSTYLSVHQGNIFILNPLNASPPMPPGLLHISPGSLDAQIQSLRHVETRRGMNQIMAATAVLDLRTIIAVRRSFHAVPSHMHNDTEAKDEETQFKNFTAEPRTAEDEEDEGGDAGLAKTQDRTRTRVRRSFELLLKTGHVLRFEAHSSGVALEWIDRLRALVIYWKLRHRTDAKQEIELAQAMRPRLTPQTRVHAEDEELPPDPPADLSAPFAAMDSLYNWCVLEGCKALSKFGRLYMRKGLRGQYKLVQLYLVAGHLVHFRINGHSSIYPAMRKKINLLDAYVCSGYLATQCLPKGQYQPNEEPAPRRYQDGLETNDREEDMLFVVWYRPQPQMFDADQDPTVTPVVSKSVPGLSAKNKMLVFKTRSILERDAWCWAINSEIEKIVRAQKPREKMLRETGSLLKLTR